MRNLCLFLAGVQGWRNWQMRKTWEQEPASSRQRVEERRGLLHDLRLVIAELDLEVGNSLSSSSGEGFIAHIEFLGLP